MGNNLFLDHYNALAAGLFLLRKNKGNHQFFRKRKLMIAATNDELLQVLYHANMSCHIMGHTFH